MLRSRFSTFLLLSIKLIIITTFVIIPSIYYSDFILPSQFTKTVFLSYITSILLILTAIYLWLAEIVISFTLIDIFVILLWAYITFNRYCLHTNIGYSLRFIELCNLLIFYFALRLFSNRSHLTILIAIVLGGMIQIVEGGLQLLEIVNSQNDYFKVTGNFFNPGGYCGYLLLVNSIAAGIFFNNKDILIQDTSKTVELPHKTILNFLFKNLSFLYWLSSTAIIFSLKSRSAIIGVLLLLIATIIYKHYTKFKTFITSFSIKTILGFLIGIIIVFYGLYNLKKESADGRLLIYKISSQLALINPIYGVGFDNFKTFYMNRQGLWFTDKGNYESPDSYLADDTIYAYTEPLQFLVENGIIGILIIVYFAWKIRIRSINWHRSYLIIIATSTFASFIIFGLFTYTCDNLAMKIVATNSLAVITNLGLRHYTFHITQNKFEFLFKTFCFFIFFAGIYSCKKNNTYVQAFTEWRKAQKLYAFGEYHQSVLFFEKALPVLNNSGEFLLEFGKTLELDKNYYRALIILNEAKKYLSSSVIEITIGNCEKQLGHYADAENSYIHARNMIPSRFYPNFLLLELYIQMGAKTKAIQKATEIKMKPIKIPSKAIYEIKEYAKKYIQKQNS